jgi:hypothetical protein
VGWPATGSKVAPASVVVKAVPINSNRIARSVCASRAAFSITAVLQAGRQLLRSQLAWKSLRLIAERVATSLGNRGLTKLDVTLREHPDAWAGYTKTLD